MSGLSLTRIRRKRCARRKWFSLRAQTNLSPDWNHARAWCASTMLPANCRALSAALRISGSAWCRATKPIRARPTQSRRGRADRLIQSFVAHDDPAGMRGQRREHHRGLRAQVEHDSDLDPLAAPGVRVEHHKPDRRRGVSPCYFDVTFSRNCGLSPTISRNRRNPTAPV